MAKTTVRAFIAIPLPADLLDQIGRLQRKLEIDVPPRSVRWVRASGIHLTLKFLGDTAVERLPAIKSALGVIARIAPPCPFTVSELGCFPNSSRPRVIWVGVQEPTGRMAALQAAVEEAMETLGYEPERRGFTPHLTLGRVHRRASSRDRTGIGKVVAAKKIGPLGEVPGDRFELIQSVLKPTGAEYTTLEAFVLN
jgi:2'-5' RNA ligase